MKYLLYIYIPLILLLSCVDRRTTSEKIERPVEVINVRNIPELAKLKYLMSLPEDSMMDYFDLSNDSIRKFPDLSKYIIKTLNMSFNQLDTFIEKYLPQRIEKLIISHNKLKKNGN